MGIYKLIQLIQVFTYRKNLVKKNSITPSVGKKGRCHNFFLFTCVLLQRHWTTSIKDRNTHTSLLVVYCPYNRASNAVHLTGSRPLQEIHHQFLLSWRLQRGYFLLLTNKWPRQIASLPWISVHTHFLVVRLWPFRSLLPCTFLFLQPTRYERQDPGEWSKITKNQKSGRTSGFLVSEEIWLKWLRL